MSDHSEAAEHVGGTTITFSYVWIALLVMTGIEVFLAYEQLPTLIMLTALLGLSVVKAALIIAYFMHLRFERLNLVLTIVPALVIAICLLMVFFPDSFRSRELRYGGAPPSAEGH